MVSRALDREERGLEVIVDDRVGERVCVEDLSAGEPIVHSRSISHARVTA